MKSIHIILFLISTAASAQPYEPIVLWEREGAGDSSYYGTEILALGDQNDDGFNDWAVYAQGISGAPEGHPYEPKVEFFHGGNPPDAEPYMVRVMDRVTESRLRGARALGDLNGDEYEDWCIFIDIVENPETPPLVKVYFGGPNSGNQPDIEFSIHWLYPAGDFNGDGFDDLYLLRSPTAIVFGESPMDTTPDWLSGRYLGFMASGGDLNADGYSDLVDDVDATQYQDLDVYLGSVEPETSSTYHWPARSQIPSIVRSLNGDNFDEIGLRRSGWGKIYFGGATLDTIEDARLDFPCFGGPEPGGPSEIVSAGDFNDDGYNDVIMFAEFCPDSWYGTLTFHLGGSWVNSNPVFVIQGWTDPLNLIGIRVATGLGDINGDGVDDFAIGANDDIAHAGRRGKAVILSGDTSLHVSADDPFVLLPSEFAVHVSPNPFNSSTRIDLVLPPFEDEAVLTLYNLLGQIVHSTRLLNLSGYGSYTLDASSLTTGIYLLHAESGAFQTTSKLVLLK